MNSLKPISTFLIILLFVINGCTSEGEEPTQTHACKLIQTAFTSSLTTGENQSGVSDFNYNDQGLLKDVTSLTEVKDNSGQLKTSSSSKTQYEYNADGYLIKSTSESEYSQGSNAPYKNSSNSVYQYQEGRLIKTSSESISGQTTYLYTYTYDYDANGKLSKYTLITTFAGGSSSNIFDLTNQKITMTGFTGAKTEGELNAEGYVIKEINLAGVERRYQYDDQGNLLRQEEWTNNKMFHVIICEYDTKMNPNYMSSYLTFKGVPDMKFYRSISPIHNYTKETDYKVDASGNQILNYTNVHTIQYNALEYPVTIETLKSEVTGVVLSNTNTTYTYKDCE